MNANLALCNFVVDNRNVAGGISGVHPPLVFQLTSHKRNPEYSPMSKTKFLMCTFTWRKTEAGICASSMLLRIIFVSELMLDQN